jgi:hypothetical protein
MPTIPSGWYSVHLQLLGCDGSIFSGTGNDMHHTVHLEDLLTGGQLSAIWFRTYSSHIWRLLVLAEPHPRLILVLATSGVGFTTHTTLDICQQSRSIRSLPPPLSLCIV